MAIDNALPWFPLTPDYIDKYYSDVLKYLRDSFEMEESEIRSDKSFCTTASLLMQRAEEIRAKYVSRSLQEVRSVPRGGIEKDAKIVAAAVLYAGMFHKEGTIRLMSLLCFILAVLSPEQVGALSSIALRCVKASAITGVGYNMDDVIRFNVPDLVKKMENSTMEKSADVRWFQNHGTVKVDPEGVSLYSTSRLFVNMKEITLRPVVSIEGGQVRVMQGKTPGKAYAFDKDRFLDDCADVKDDEEKVFLKSYADGDILSVRVKSVTYDTILAESVDPSYEKVRWPIRITGGATNVRGLYITDFARNMKIGDVINVEYMERQKCFSIDGTIIEFIYNHYWAEQEDGFAFDSTIGVLLFQHSGEVPNTWLTREGFLVRTTENETYPRYTQKCLDVVDYDDKYDFLIAEVAEDAPEDQRVNEIAARDSFIHSLLYLNKQIITPVPKKPEVKRIPSDLLTELHRIEALRSEFAVSGSANRQEMLKACMMMSFILGDDADFGYYVASLDYLDCLIAFAGKDFGSVTPLDKRNISGERIMTMGVMTAILAQYGKTEESAVIDDTIKKLPGTSMATVAKLVQAANRLMGTPSLERLRVDLHREICTVLGVSDSIAPEPDDEERFPFKPEGENIEHKMSWVFDNETGLFNETSQSFKCMKTICAFMNRYAEQGESHLYIGTDEKRRFVNGFRQDVDELIMKGEIKAAGDVEDEYMRVIVMGKIRDRFPDTYQNVTPTICCGGKVLDLCVQPAKEGVVYLNGVAYYRSGSESKVMNPTIEDEIRNRKYLLRNGMADKIDAVRRAVISGHTVCLVGYDSSSSNTPEKDRKVEAFAFTDSKRCDAVWAFDPKDRKNKVFLLKRADAVTVLDECWKYEKSHKTFDLDIFGFSGNESIPFDIVLKTTRSKNQFVEQYPSVAANIQRMENGGWRVKATLFNSLSLEAACSFYLGISDELDISASPELKAKVNERLERIVAGM